MPVYALNDRRPRIHPTAFVHPDAVLIGEVVLGAEASVWPSAVIRADNGPITVGARTSIQDGAIIHIGTNGPTTIGADCVIGHLVHMESCTIEDCVLVGSGSTVLEQAICRTVSFVAAGALVRPRMEVPSGAMAMGVPATLRLDVVTPEMILGNAASYVHHVHEYRDELRTVALEECFGER
ncbi:MAG: gamma carbonic anhydrase family protein [Acidimicrobiia bacterium]